MRTMSRARPGMTSRRGQGIGQALAVLDGIGKAFQVQGQGVVGNGLGGDPDGGEERDPGLEKEPQGPAEERGGRFPPEHPAVGDPELEPVEGDASLLLAHPPEERQDAEADREKDGHDEAADAHGERDEGRGQRRHVALEILVEDGEPGKDEVDQDAEEDEGKDDEQGRIDQGRADPRFRPGDGPGVLDEPADRPGQVAALLPGHEGGRVHLGEPVLERHEGLREGFPGAHVLLYFEEDLLEADVRGPGGQGLDALENGVARLDEGHELLVEQDEILGPDLPAEGPRPEPELLPVAADREDAETVRFDEPAALVARRGQDGPGEKPPVLGGQSTGIIGHLEEC